MATATTAQQTITRLALQQRVAARLGDLVQLTATANGTNATFIDTININSGEETYTGMQLYFTNSTNNGLTRSINGTAVSTGTITFTPNATATLATETADCYNRRGQGFRVPQYRAAINAAIQDAFEGGALLEVVSTISTVFDADTPEVTVPTGMNEVYAIEWQDTEGDWHAIPPSSRFRGYGWQMDAASGEVRIEGAPAQGADGNTIRMWGYGRQDTFTADSDTTAIPAEFLVARAAFHLCLAGIDRDTSKYGAMAGIFQSESERLRARMRVLRNPHTKRARLA